MKVVHDREGHGGPLPEPRRVQSIETGIQQLIIINHIRNNYFITRRFNDAHNEYCMDYVGNLSIA